MAIGRAHGKNVWSLSIPTVPLRTQDRFAESGMAELYVPALCFSFLGFIVLPLSVAPREDRAFRPPWVSRVPECVKSFGRLRFFSKAVPESATFFEESHPDNRRGGRRCRTRIGRQRSIESGLTLFPIGREAEID